MDSILETLLARTASLTSGALRARVIALTLLGAGLAVGAYFIPARELGALVSLLGATAGGAWFVAGYLTWHRLLPLRVKVATNFRATYPLRTRRISAVWAVGVWFLIIALSAELITGPAVGAANVAILLSIWRYASSTAAERAAALAAEDATDNVWDLPGEEDHDLPVEDRS